MTRIGLVGTGDIGRIHARSLARIPGVELVICKGHNPSRAEQLADELNDVTADSFTALLADPGVQGVTVCVPNDLHASYTIQALEAGKAVLCEKPIALTMEDAIRMEQAAARTGTPFMVGHVVRYWEDYRKARELIRSGSLGKVQVFTARRLVSLLRAVQGEEGWRHQVDRCGGAVIDLQIHDLDFILWTFGPPALVTSRGVRSHTGAFDHVFTLLEYRNGLTVQIESSFMLQGNPVVMDFRILGSEGSLEFSFIESNFAMHGIEGGMEKIARSSPPSLIHYRWNHPSEPLLAQKDDPVTAIFDAELQAFIGMVRGEPNVEVPTPTEAVQVLRLALVSRESCETGRTIEFQ